MIRNMEAREGMTRPSMRMIGHTAYLVFARKVEKLQERVHQPASQDEEEEKEEEEEEEKEEVGDKEVSE
jgi:tRNA (adenine57-N1/adenine58-N1)-methyltransferase